MNSNFKLRYHVNGRYVRITFFGLVGLEGRLQALRQLVSRFGHLHTPRLLADMRYARNRMSPAELRQVAEFILRDPRLRRARIAVLRARGLSLSAMSAERLAARGHNSRHFLVESQALAWLLD
ncbi:hypothetical protein [Microbulbifer sp. SAOS-129_SWC]|uniref:hypothetical protein n=1 Tax=Microbulbifer sp. SAOS-129_SWC TaxID=3145235 RepID=UPI0032168019